MALSVLFELSELTFNFVTHSIMITNDINNLTIICIERALCFYSGPSSWIQITKTLILQYWKLSIVNFYC